MAIRVRDKTRDFIPAPDGLQRAVCCDIVELGIVPGGKFKPRRMVKICWQSEHNMEDGKPFLLQKRYGATLGSKGAKKSNLRVDLESWRGKALTDTEADDFDLEILLGKNCQLMVMHETKDGVTYSNVASVLPAAKGDNGKVAPLLKVSDYIRIQEREGYEPPAGEPAEEEQQEETQVEVEDDIPF